jgi:endonuclease/exonuclease/phosphatase family metal-dependent hydrolase
MKYIGRLLGIILTIANILAVAALWLCAFSSHFQPTVHPIWACAGLGFPILLVVNVLFIVFWLIVYRWYAFISLLGLLVAYSSLHTYLPLNLGDEEESTITLKILSYNCEAFANGAPHTADNPNPVLDYLAHSGADIICLQEAHTGGYLSQKKVREALKDYPYSHYQQVNTTGLAIYSRLPIVSARRVPYESRTNGSMVYRVKAAWDTLTVINNHLESNKLNHADRDMYTDMMKDPEKDKVKSGSKHLLAKLAEAAAIRAPQADSIAALIARTPDRSIVVCGDFNDTPLSYAHRVIGQGLTDAFVESGNGLGISYHENRFYFRIDHILVSPTLRTYRCTVDRSIQASDHYPIWCLITPKSQDYVKYTE